MYSTISCPFAKSRALSHRLSVKSKTVMYDLKKLKFVTFLPNVKDAENPFPGASSELFVYDMNIWLPVENVVEGRVFPVKTFNRESFSLPPS